MEGISKKQKQKQNQWKKTNKKSIKSGSVSTTSLYENNNYFMRLDDRAAAVTLNLELSCHPCYSHSTPLFLELVET
jgi:hypothetical protein